MSATNTNTGAFGFSSDIWETKPAPELEPARESIDVDIACAGFGPAMGGFLSTLTHAWNENPTDSAFESRVLPGMPLQVMCYERADDLAAGVSGVVTQARGIRASFPALNSADIPMACDVARERVLYLLDPHGAVPPFHPSALGRHNSARLLPAPQSSQPRLRAALDAFVSPQARRPRPLHRPVQPVGRLAAHEFRLRPDLARHTHRRTDFP